MDQLLDDDTSEIANDAGATIPRIHHLWCGTDRFDLTIDDNDENVSDEDTPRRRGQGQGGGRD